MRPSGGRLKSQGFIFTLLTTPEHSPASTDVDHEADLKTDYSNRQFRLEDPRPPSHFDHSIECPHHTTERALIRKIDLHVIPLLCILYLLAFLDRVNIANAKSFNLTTDLSLTSLQYNTCLTIFFIPYTFFEIPSNILLKHLSPRIWLSTLMFLFGIASVAQGLVQNYSGLLATRFFLGLFEAGMLPGCFYLITMWYKRNEAQQRCSLFFSSTSLAGAFGGLLASAIGKMDGIRGYSGWRWIFILEGILTCLIALSFFFLLPAFPEDATWLTSSERTYIKARLQADQGKSAAERKISAKDVFNVFKDYKIFLGGFMYFGLIVPAYGFSFFAPTIIGTYGYSAVETQLHSVAPYACSFVFAMLIAYASDKLKHRFLFTILSISIAIAGFIILLCVHDNRSLEYGALFLVAIGCYSAMPVVICWFNMNLSGHRRRAVGTAWQVGFGNTGGIISTFAFFQSDAKNFYRTGYAISVAFIGLAAVSCGGYVVALVRENGRREKRGDGGLTEWEKGELGVSLMISGSVRREC